MTKKQQYTCYLVCFAIFETHLSTRMNLTWEDSSRDWVQQEFNISETHLLWYIKISRNTWPNEKQLCFKQWHSKHQRRWKSESWTISGRPTKMRICLQIQNCEKLHSILYRGVILYKDDFTEPYLVKSRQRELLRKVFSLFVDLHSNRCNRGQQAPCSKEQNHSNRKHSQQTEIWVWEQLKDLNLMTWEVWLGCRRWANQRCTNRTNRRILKVILYCPGAKWIELNELKTSY